MAGPPQFVGQTLGHYRIQEQIGAGGMGVVFRAHDERLERDVAIKVLPPGTFADESARKRFRKEALTLSRLNHPNIATIFDFDQENGVDFLVTEFIPGATLDTLLYKGSLPEKQVIALGLQLSDALNAAHEKGIVHCDLKPENLRLTSDGRLKVLDFGIAKLVQPPDENALTATITTTNEIRGTLPYMAPEQLLGAQPDMRTDIWATGAVLYQLSTGNMPFPAKVATALAADIIHTAPIPPSQIRPQLSPLLETTILKCLEKKAEHRYQSIRELKVDLERVATRSAPALEKAVAPVIAQPSVEEKRIPLRKGIWVAVGFAVVVALAIGLGWHWLVERPRRSVAVLGFKNSTGNGSDDWISGVLVNQLPTELATGQKLRIISEEDVSRAKQDFSLANSDSLGKDTLARLRRRLNADLVVLGSYLNIDGQLRVDLRVQDASAGDLVVSFAETGSVDNIEQLVTRTGFDLRQKLGLEEIDPEEAGMIQASMPASAEAARYYAEGIAKLRMFDALGSRDLLKKAIAADPNYAMAHSALSAVWDQLGYDTLKREEAKKAFELSSKLPREQRLLVEARYREATADWDKAVDIYRSLQTFVPDELDYGLRLVSTQTRAGRGQAALSTVQELRRMPAPQKNDPRIDLVEAEAAESISDYKLERKATQQTIEKAKQNDALLLMAQAQWRSCIALFNLGDLDNARAAGEQAMGIYGKLSDHLGEARSLTCVANVVDSKGDPVAAQRLHEQALGLATSIGAQRDSAGASINVANLLSSRGDLEGAIKHYQAAMAICREIGDQSQLMLAENNLGAIYFTQGNYEDAGRIFESSRETAKEVGDLGSAAQAQMNLSIIRLQQGDLVQARQNIQEAVAATRQLGMQSDSAAALQTLGDILLAQDDLDGAAKAYAESLDIQTKLGQKAGMANSRMSLAGLELERAHAPEAEKLARQATDEFAGDKNADGETQARDLLAKSLLAQGKVGDAGMVLKQNEKLQATDRMIRLDFAITSARVLAREGKHAVAVAKLEETFRNAKAMGLKGYELEARLALGEVQLQAHDSQSLSSLRVLQKDASRQGFSLIARKAAALANRA